MPDLGAVQMINHPRLRAALREVEDSIGQAWQQLLTDTGTTDARILAEIVLQDPAEFDWRVVDAALKHLPCDTCQSPELGAGPLGCPSCDLANGFRFAAREVDRPNVPPGNEHAIRVASAVARTRHRYTPRARCGYELLLPDLLSGHLPTTPQAQQTKSQINLLPDALLETLITPTDLQTATTNQKQ